MIELCVITTLATLYEEDGYTYGHAANVANQTGPAIARLIEEHDPDTINAALHRADPDQNLFLTRAVRECLPKEGEG